MKDKIVKFILNLQFVVRPDFWFMQISYSEHWDKVLNNLMDNVKPKLNKPNSLDGEIYTINFENVEVWVRNYPYSYGYPYVSKNEAIRVRPSRLTIKRLKKFVDAEIVKNSQRVINEKIKWIN